MDDGSLQTIDPEVVNKVISKCDLSLSAKNAFVKEEEDSSSMQIESKEDITKSSLTTGISQDIQISSGNQEKTVESADDQYETIIFLDYDDTLLASSWLNSKNLSLKSTVDHVIQYAEELRVIEASAMKLLSKTLELGDVHLVTNAEAGWVEMTVEKFMPALSPLLPHVSVISARSLFEAYFPMCPQSWKLMAFRQQVARSLINSMKSSMLAAATASSGNSKPARGSMDVSQQLQVILQRKVNLISLGDSAHEKQALHLVAAEFPNAYSKTIKFIEKPEIDALQKQMEIVHTCFEKICDYKGNLDLALDEIMFEVAKQKPCQ